MKFLCDPQILPTNTCPPDYVELGRRSGEYVGFAKQIQLDVADGDFAPVTSWPYFGEQRAELERMVSKHVQLPHSETLEYEAHLMVRDPVLIGEQLARIGCKRILPHVETLGEVAMARDIFARWKQAGAKEVGIAVLLETSLSTIAPYVDLCNVVQLMSIAQIGAQGQPFDERTLSKVEELHATYPSLRIAVDGGVTEANVEELVRAGANHLCVGAAISKSDDPAAAFARIRERAIRGCAPLTLDIGV